MRRAVPILLILWAVAGIAWALLQDEPDAAPETEASGEVATPPGPGLAARGTTGASRAPAEASVPEAILRSAQRLRTVEDRRAFFAWLGEDPARVLALLRTWAGASTQDARGCLEVAQRVRSLFSAQRDRLLNALQHVFAALREPQDDEVYLAALLGAVAGAGIGDPQAERLAARYVRDASLRDELRQLAALILLAWHTSADDARVAIGVALAGDASTLAPLTRRVLALLQSQGAAAAPWLEDLLAFYAHGTGRTWPDLEVLQTLRAIAPDDPRVRGCLVQALRRPDSSVARFARTWLFQGDVEDALAFLDTAPAQARVEGVEALLQRGVAAERLAPHVLAALHGGGFGLRTRAVKLLGKVCGDVARVLPVIEELLASDDKSRWLSGVEALGALATVPGDKGPAVERLLDVGRRPDVRVRTAAVQAILMHDAQPAPVIEFLTFLLDDGDAGVRAEAVDGLGELSAKHAAARQALERARTDASSEVREVVAYWLDEDD